MKNQHTFAVDGMLGRLGKYLRALGYDTRYAAGPHESFMETVETEGRVFITLRRDVSQAFTGIIVHLEESAIERQLAEIFKRIDATPARERVLTVCLECNHATEPAAAETVTDFVPPNIRETISSYRICPHCGRVYWWGSHADRIMALLEKSGVFS
jgi:uncharacterized protein with PIN domain